MAEATLTIDGTLLAVQEEATILEAARAHSIDIPTLCHLDGVSDVAACRMCLVEVAGSARPLPACVTKTADGMVVQTATKSGGSQWLLTERRTSCAPSAE